MELNKADRAARAKYLREWRAKNPEKVKEHEARYWKKRVAKEKLAKGENV